MKIYLLSALLPCIWAADFRNIQCPDGSLCPIGKTCCPSTGQSFSCCDLAEEEKHNKKLVPAISTSISRNVPFSTCDGTECSSIFCCDYKQASCCTATSCCPNGYKCCGSAMNTMWWCCKTNQRCAVTYKYCMAGAAALSPGFVAMILILIVTVVSKRF